MSKFWNFIKNQAGEGTTENIELRIQGDIISTDDSWFYEWLGIPCASPNTFRNELSQHKGKDITLWIDSNGGDVFAGAGIYNALMEHDGKVTAKITKAMSAASVIAMAADEILMSPVGIMMIHNPLSYASGYASDLRKTADVLDTVKECIMNAYCTKTKVPRDKVSKMMDDETYMDAKTAKEEGFCDGILYEDSGIQNNKVLNFAFNRISIQNCANESFKKFFEVQKIANKKEGKSSVIIKPINMDPSSCVCQSCNHGDNCQSSGAACCICGNCSNVSQCTKPGADGCQCNICTLAQNNACQPGGEKCQCSTCSNQDTCGRGQMDNSSMEAQNSNKLTNNKKEEGSIMNLSELKEKFPEVYNAATNEGKEVAVKAEMERLKAFDVLNGKVDPAFLNEEKYKDGATAESVLFKALQEGKMINASYVNQAAIDAANANMVPGATSDNNKPDEVTGILNFVKNTAQKTLGNGGK